MNRGFAGLISCALLLLSTTGCATPQVVKDLSAAQLKAQIAAKDQLKSYFEVVERFVEGKINEASQQLEELNKDSLDKLQQKLVGADPGSSRPVDKAALVDYTNAVSQRTANLRQRQDQLQQRLATLRAKQAEFLAAYETLISAQAKLDEYVRLEKADEKLASELLSAVGVSQAQFTDAADSLAGAAGGIDTLLAAVN